jgi:hypothetical protein
MSTWWEQRVAHVTEAANMVARQTGCSMGEALSMLRQRAEKDGTDLEEISETVIGKQARLGYRDLAESDAARTRDTAAVAPR